MHGIRLLVVDDEGEINEKHHVVKLAGEDLKKLADRAVHRKAFRCAQECRVPRRARIQEGCVGHGDVRLSVPPIAARVYATSACAALSACPKIADTPRDAFPLETSGGSMSWPISSRRPRSARSMPLVAPYVRSAICAARRNLPRPGLVLSGIDDGDRFKGQH